MARTQQQRREATVASLLDASIATIAEIGYARASAKEISRRAGVSDGALFRHFPTMGEFMAATACEALRRQLERFGKQVSEIPAGVPAPEAVLNLLNDLTHSSTNAVVYELLIAARTDATLRSALREVLAEYGEKLCDAARELPGADAYAPEQLPDLVALLANAFDGAAIVGAVLPQPEIEARRIPLLLAMLPTQA